MTEVISASIRGAVGLAIAGGILAVIFKRHATEWQEMASVYDGSGDTPLRVKRFGQLVLYCDGAPARPYKGLFRLEVYANGIALKPYRFLVPFHDPMFIPFRDIEGWTQTWYLDDKSVELQFAKAPRMRIIMPASQLDWIRETSGKRIHVSEQKPPHGRWPWVTHVSAMVLGALGLSVGLLVLLRSLGVISA